MELKALDAYESRGLSESALERLSVFGDLLLGAGHNVTGIREPREIERQHFLDSLTLLEVREIVEAARLVDVGSGGGVPAVVLAVVLPELTVVAVESVGKKCGFIERVSGTLGLENLFVECVRAEEYGRSAARESFDVAVTRAVGRLAVDAELAVPLIRVGGLFVAMKGALSDQERILGSKALAILGVDAVEERHVRPYPGAENRRLYLGRKTERTPGGFPRRVGIPAKRPLG